MWLADSDAIVERAAQYARGLADPTDWRDYLGSGVLGVTMPVAVGGEGRSTSALVATLEGLAYGGADAGILFSLAAQIFTVQHAILTFGSPEQQQEWLPPLIRGDRRAAHAATEPTAGSDVFAMETRAIPCAGGYRLTGEKRYITNAPVADVALVLASTDPRRRNLGLSAFLVDLDAEGVSRSDAVPTTGLTSAQLGEIRFADCFVPASRRLGDEGSGAAVFTASLALERAFILAPALGVMRRELERAVAHANTRMQRGRTIGAFQSVSNRIADMAVRLEISRLLIYQAAAFRDAGRSTRDYAPLVKLAVSELYVQSCLDAVRNEGAAGYLRDDRAAIDYRDALGSLFYSGTSDVLRNLIAGYAGVSDG